MSITLVAPTMAQTALLRPVGLSPASAARSAPSCALVTGEIVASRTALDQFVMGPTAVESTNSDTPIVLWPFTRTRMVDATSAPVVV